MNWAVETKEGELELAAADNRGRSCCVLIKARSVADLELSKSVLSFSVSWEDPYLGGLIILKLVLFLKLSWGCKSTLDKGGRIKSLEELGVPISFVGNNYHETDRSCILPFFRMKMCLPYFRICSRRRRRRRR